MKLATAFIASILSLTTLDARATTPIDDTYSVTVRFADLDLTSRVGLATLYQRIKGAAKHVCYQQADELPLDAQDSPGCMKQAIAAAISRINLPGLRDYVAQIGGNQVKTSTPSVAMFTAETR